MVTAHTAKEAGGVFEVRNETDFAGELTYSQKEQIMTIDHTEVYPAFQGQGVGKKLVKMAVDFAREKDLKIIAKCTYAKKLMERTSEYDDLLI